MTDKNLLSVLPKLSHKDYEIIAFWMQRKLTFEQIALLNIEFLRKTANCFPVQAARDRSTYIKLFGYPKDIETIRQHIIENGPISAFRVSSAQARGSARKYRYWGAVKYEIILGRDGWPIAKAKHAAPSRRRSYRLAEKDADIIAAKIGAIRCQAIGALGWQSMSGVIKALGLNK